MPILPNHIFVITTTRRVLPLGTSNLVTFFSTRSFYSVIFVSNHTTIFWPCFVLLLCCQERIFIEIFLMRLLISISILSPNYIQNTISMFDEKDLQNLIFKFIMQLTFVHVGCLRLPPVPSSPSPLECKLNDSKANRGARWLAA